MRVNNAYASASQRMHRHAKALSAEAQLGTADHLFGLAAECALKAILLAYNVIPPPPDLPADKSARKKYSVHINQLWSEYVTWTEGLAANKLPLLAASKFDSWNVHNRYHHDDFFSQV